MTCKADRTQAEAPGVPNAAEDSMSLIFAPLEPEAFLIRFLPSSQHHMSTNKDRAATLTPGLYASAIDP